MSVTDPPPATGQQWSVRDAEELYDISSWSDGHVVVTERGTVAIRPDTERDAAIDVPDFIAELSDRGLEPPLIIRFSDLMRCRMRAIRDAFDSAMQEADYQGGYTGIYPIKVNQQRHVCEDVLSESRRIGFGLEAGSKPELWAVLGLTASPDTRVPIVCNGFKDAEYLETVVLASKLGRDITPIIEHPSEIAQLLDLAEHHDADIKLGVRYRPASPGGSGRWAESAGERSKFGLSPSQLVEAIDTLRERGAIDKLRLLHFHVGSQIADIERFSLALGELAATYVELRRLGAPLDSIDVGGGLGVDYVGSKAAAPDAEHVLNYSLSDYTREVVRRVASACDEAREPHPRILSESGRAMVASASVLVMDIHARTARPTCTAASDERARIEKSGRETPATLDELLELLESAGDQTPTVLMSAARRLHADLVALYRLGSLSLPLRAVADRVFWTICRIASDRDECESPSIPDAEADSLRTDLADLIVTNASIFQSLPDAWAIGQVFPAMPLSRLDERPTRRVRLVDLTCDSDGRIDLYQSREGARPWMWAHDEDPGQGRSSLIGVFHVGAYQEVLGDLHNLFGDAHVVHVSLDEQGKPEIDESIPGDSVRDVLGYVQHDSNALLESMRRDIERAQKEARLTLEQGQSLLRHYAQGLDGYTYMED